MSDPLEKRIQDEMDYIFRKDLSLEETKKDLRAVICEGTKCSVGSPLPITLSDVLSKPLTYFSPKGIDEIMLDIRPISFEEPTKTQRILRTIGLNLYIAGSFGVWAMPHELLHAAMNNLTGGITKEIVVNKLYGGDLWHAAFPDIQTKFLFPLIGAYVNVQPAGHFAEITTLLAPYALTPLGIYLVQKSKEDDKKMYWIAGVGLLGAHAGGIIGDFFAVGQKITGTAAQAMYKHPDEIQLQQHKSLSDNLVFGAALVGGFLLGNRLMGYTYRLSKGLVNSVRNIYKK